MDANNAVELLKVGALVNIRNSQLGRGRIVESLGPIGPGGVRIYRVRLRGKPYPAYGVFREDQLVSIPANP